MAHTLTIVELICPMLHTISKTLDDFIIISVCIILIQKLFVRDCILVKSGKRKDDKPYVAKVASIWQESGLKIPQSNHLSYLPYFFLFFLAGLMMTVFWYYRTEDVDSVIASQFCEVSMHASFIP